MGKSKASDWPYYRERITVVDALESGFCHDGVLDFINDHGRQISIKATEMGDFSEEALKACHGNGWSSEDYGSLGEGYGYRSGGDGISDGWGGWAGRRIGDGYGAGFGYGRSLGASYPCLAGDGEGNGSGNYYGNGSTGGISYRHGEATGALIVDRGD